MSEGTITRTVDNKAQRCRVAWIQDSSNAKFAHPAYDHKMKKHLQSSVAKIKNLGCGRSKSLVKEELVRIDLQGTFTREGKRWANIQAQLNIQTKEHTTIAAAYIQIESKGQIVIRYVRDCILRSFREQKAYWLKVNKL